MTLPLDGRYTIEDIYDSGSLKLTVPNSDKPQVFYVRNGQPQLLDLNQVMNTEEKYPLGIFVRDQLVPHRVQVPRRCVYTAANLIHNVNRSRSLRDHLFPVSDRDLDGETVNLLWGALGVVVGNIRRAIGQLNPAFDLYPFVDGLSEQLSRAKSHVDLESRETPGRFDARLALEVAMALEPERNTGQLAEKLGISRAKTDFYMVGHEGQS